MGILRLPTSTSATPDLDLATAYYTEVMGLHQVERTEDTGLPQVLGRGGPPLAAAALRPPDRDGPVHLPGRARGRPGRPRDAASSATAATVRRVSRGEAVGQGESIRFEIPSRPDHGAGPRRREGRQHPAASSTRRRSRRRTCRASRRRASTTCWSTPRRSARPTRFFKEVLGFRLTEQVLDGNGHQLGVWLERSHSPHDIAIVNGPNGGAAPLRVLARRLGPRPQGGRHPGLQRRPDRPGPDPPRRHPRQHHLLLRPARHPQRGVHRRLPARPGLPAASPGPRTTFGRGLFYYENVVSAAVPEGAHLRSGGPHPAPAARRGPGARPRAVHRLLHRGARPDRDRARTENRVFLKCWDEHEHHSVVLRQAADLRPGPHGLQGRRRRRPRLLHRAASRRVGVPGEALRRAASSGPGWGEAIRFEAPDRARRRARPRHGEGRQHAAADQPAAAPAGPGRDRAAAARPRLRHGRGRRGGHRVLPRRARVPAHRADPGQRRPPARHLAGALATPRTTSPWSPGPNGGAAPLRVLARRLERRPRRRRHPAPTTA